MSSKSIHHVEMRERILALEKQVAKLQAKQQNYQGILENMELGILEVDLEERIVKAYPKFCELLGYTEEELIGKKASEKLLDQELHEQMDKQTLARNKGESGLYEVPVRTKLGEVKWLLISGVPVRNAKGEIVGSMGTHYDISERKRDEEALMLAKIEAEKARQAEREFLTKMSHEIRTPMNAIMGMSVLMSETGLDADQRKLLNGIQHGSALLQRMLDGVMDLSKLEANQMECRLEAAELALLFEAVVASFEPLLKEKGVLLSCSLAPELNGRFMVDGPILSRVLTNLIGNAAKFTAKGSIEVSAQWNPNGEGKEGRLDVQVKDSGVGIKASDTEHIFGRFKQASNRKVEHGGTGLGLAIVKELCQLHGGDVSVQSTLGRGSTFSFHFAARKVAKEVNKAHQEIADLRGVRILVAEDNALNLFFIQTLLKRWGCNATFVSDGHEAIEEWRSKTFDVILMDIQMPNCTGLEATAVIRSEQKKNDKAHLPIVALSAFAFDHDKEEALGVGMDDYLIKPYTEEQLMNVLRRYRPS